MDNFDRAREGRQTVDIEILQDRVRRLDERLRVVERRVSDLVLIATSADEPARVCADCGQQENDHTGVRHPFRSRDDA